VSFDPKDKNNLYKTNVEGTQNLINASLASNVRKFCFVSSIASLGRVLDNQVITEETQWKESKQNSKYARSKFLAENEVWRGCAEGLEVVIVNPGIIIGPGFWHKGSGSMIKLSWKGLKFFTNGINGFVDVRDVSRAMIELTNSSISGQSYILVAENFGYKAFYEVAADGLQKKRPAIYANPLIGEIVWRLAWLVGVLTGSKTIITKETIRTANQKYNYANEKIKQAIGFEFIPISQSIQDTCKLFLKDISKTL